MTPSIEERIQQLESTSRTHDAMLNLLITISERQQGTLERQQETSERQQEILERHQETLERQQEILERHQETLERHQETLERQQEILEEVRRDARQTQRLWVRLAQRHGWLEDDDLLSE